MMDAKVDIKSFWTSLITEKGISPHVESLMKIDDKEERGLALMSRVFFLWCMGIKYQREDLEQTFDLIRIILSKASDSKPICSKCAEIKALLKEKDFDENVMRDENKPVSLIDSTNITSKRKNLTDSPPHPIKKICIEDKENIDSSPEKGSSIEILVPETEPYLQIEDRVHEHFIIPETVPIEDGLYGNTDFYDVSEDPEDSKSLVPDKCNTSPVLGKVSKLHNSPALQKKTFKFSEPTKIRSDISLSPTCAKENNINKTIITSPESLENSPSLLGCNILKQNLVIDNSSSTFEENKAISKPLTEHINLEGESMPTPVNKLEIPSNLQSGIDKDNSFNMKKNLRSTTSRNPLIKFKSEAGGSLSNKSRLSRLKTLTSMKDNNTNLEICFDQKEKKKVYRQTKITQDSFFKPVNTAKPTGGKCDMLDIDDDDKAIEKAIEASLHTKEVEDILRKKHEEIDKEIVKKKIQKSPLEKTLRKSPRTKCQKSLQFGSPSASTSKVSEEEVFKVLDKNKTLKAEEGNGHSKCRRIKKTVFQDSFDVLPTMDDEPKYAYKGDVARKNSEKQRLDGWNCHECRDFYESKDLTEEQRKILQNKCSRHRSKYKPLTNTPEGFWKVGWSDEES